MSHPDKELWDKVRFNEKYEYIPIPTSVAKILRRKVKGEYGEEILLIHWYKENPTSERSIIMRYVRYDGRAVWRGQGGYSSHLSPGEKLQDRLVILAKEIAETWPKYAVKHQTPK